jgi:MYND finger
VHAPKCEHCGKPALHVCSRCKKTPYCSKTCAQAESKKHFEACCPEPISGTKKPMGMFAQVSNRISHNLYIVYYLVKFAAAADL